MLCLEEQGNKQDKLTLRAAAQTTATAQDDAVRAAYNQGITILAAAGNNDVSLSY